jgi:hypothetical protein
MPPRAKGRAGSKGLPPRPPGPGTLSLTKKDVVERELKAAIRLYVAEGDPVPIHVLVSAVLAILHAVGKANGKDTSRILFLDHIKDEHSESVEVAIDSEYEFMKHGSKDPFATLQAFDPRINASLLFFACYDYATIYRVPFEELKIFMALQVSEKPSLLKEGARGTYDSVIASVLALAESSTMDLQAAARAIAKIDELKRPVGRGRRAPNMTVPTSQA